MVGRMMIAAAGVALSLAVAPAKAQVLEIATDQSPVGLDPHVATAFSTTMVLSTIYEGLTAIDPELRVVPALAESWIVSPDGLTYTFHLRAGATFHDGKGLQPRRCRRVDGAGTRSEDRLAARVPPRDGRSHRSRRRPRRPLRAVLAVRFLPRAACHIGDRSRRRRRPGEAARRDRSVSFQGMAAEHLHRARPQRRVLAERPSLAGRIALRDRTGGDDAAAGPDRGHLSVPAGDRRRDRDGTEGRTRRAGAGDAGSCLQPDRR